MARPGAITVSYREQKKTVWLPWGVREHDTYLIIRATCETFGITCAAQDFTLRDDDGKLIGSWDDVETGQHLILTCEQKATQDDPPGAPSTNCGVDPTSIDVNGTAQPGAPSEMLLRVKYEWRLANSSESVCEGRLQVAVKSDDLLSDVCTMISSGLGAPLQR